MDWMKGRRSSGKERGGLKKYRNGDRVRSDGGGGAWVCGEGKNED
jgi:hypothetical protein